MQKKISESCNMAEWTPYCGILTTHFNVSTCNSKMLWDLQLIFYRRVWRYQRGNQNPYIEEEQTTQWPKEKVQEGKQRSKKHTYKTKDRIPRTRLKTRDVLRCSGRVGSSRSTSDTRRVNLVTNPVRSHEWRKDREVFTTSGTNISVAMQYTMKG